MRIYILIIGLCIGFVTGTVCEAADTDVSTAVAGDDVIIDTLLKCFGNSGENKNTDLIDNMREPIASASFTGMKWVKEAFEGIRLKHNLAGSKVLRIRMYLIAQSPRLRELYNDMRNAEGEERGRKKKRLDQEIINATRDLKNNVFHQKWADKEKLNALIAEAKVRIGRDEEAERKEAERRRSASPVPPAETDDEDSSDDLPVEAPELVNHGANQMVNAVDEQHRMDLAQLIFSLTADGAALASDIENASGHKKTRLYFIEGVIATMYKDKYNALSTNHKRMIEGYLLSKSSRLKNLKESNDEEKYKSALNQAIAHLDQGVFHQNWVDNKPAHIEGATTEDAANCQVYGSMTPPPVPAQVHGAVDTPNPVQHDMGASPVSVVNPAPSFSDLESSVGSMHSVDVMSQDSQPLITAPAASSSDVRTRAGVSVQNQAFYRRHPYLTGGLVAGGALSATTIGLLIDHFRREKSQRYKSVLSKFRRLLGLGSRTEQWQKRAVSHAEKTVQAR